jgi:DNA-binding IscR family transcriptional regulator
VGHCILDALAKVFASAQNAMECDLAKTTLADVIDAVKASGAGARKKAG